MKLQKMIGILALSALSACAVPKANSWSILTGTVNSNQRKNLKLVSQGKLTDRLDATLIHNLGTTEFEPNNFSPGYTEINSHLNIMDLAEGRYTVGAFGVLETFPGKDSVSRVGGVIDLPLKNGTLQLRPFPFRMDDVNETRCDLFYRQNFRNITIEVFGSYKNGKSGNNWFGYVIPTLNFGDYGVGVQLDITKDKVTPSFAIEKRF